MNKKLLLLPLFMMTLSACGTSSSSSAAPESEDTDSLIETMRLKTYRVTFTGTQSKTYPKGYEAYNTSEEVTYTRDYGYVEGNTSNPRAVRIITDSTMSTYFESEDGRIYSQIVREDNTVERSYLSTNGMFYRFSKYYSSPFDYISEEDFDEEMNLNAQKSYLLFNDFTGEQQPVESAKVTLGDDGLISRIDFTFDTLPVGITTEDGTETCDYDLVGSMTFDYDISPIAYMTPYTEKSDKYETVVADLGDNYTITADSNATSARIALYAAGETLLLHLDASKEEAVTNDMLYIKRGNKYRTYVYTGKEWTMDESTEASSIFPDYSGLSSYLIEDKSDTHLSLKSEASAYGADNFLLPYMGLTAGTGLKADMYLNKDGKIDYTTSTFYYYSGNIVVKNTYSDYGTTSMPVWLEMPEY